MKSKRNIERILWVVSLFGLCFIILMASCDEDESPKFTQYYILGLHEVNPGDTAIYSLGNHTGEFIWSSSNTDIAEIISSEGSDAEVIFKRSGEITLGVTDGIKSGALDVSVSAATVEVTVYYGGSGSLRNTTKDTVFLSFIAPLAELPTLTLNGINASDTSGFFLDVENDPKKPFNSLGETLSVLSPYKGSESIYYAIYGAGTGNGQPEARLESIKISEVYGGEKLDSVYIKLPLVDNTAPVGEISLSEEFANDSTIVHVTVFFSEAMRPVMASEADTLVFVNISGGGVQTVRDTLWMTGNPKVWSLDYMTNGAGNGTLKISVDVIIDLAGNVCVSLPDGTLTVDNIPPVATGSVSILPDSRAISIDTDGFWLLVPAGSDAPIGLSDFSAGSFGDKIFVADPGQYDAYFIAVDAAGNVSEIVSQPGISILD